MTESLLRLPRLPDLSARVRAEEIMDRPGLERERHLRSLDALAVVGRLSRTAPRVWAAVRRLAARGVRPVRVLDVACGGGDVLNDLARRARRSGIDVRLVGCDASEVALERARAHAGGSARFERVDVLRDPLPGSHDVVTCSLFLHHLGEREAAGLLRAMAERAEHVLLVQDLRRSRLGYVLAWATLRVITRSDVARSDGPVSVRAAFTPEEAEALAREAGLEEAVVRRCWPQRWRLRWERS
ncbi:MAG TPA: methyltransferase domain-containing protein [Longimicrobiales bacterium]|nr:methyltransferase domain-containing protein [Longimicrobiales bacterium]